MSQIDIISELKKRRAGRTWMVVASEIGCSRSHLSEVLHGKKSPGPKVRKYLGVNETIVYIKTEQS